MGNTPSHQQQNTNIYSSYIQQQQDLIYKQQQQINELYKFSNDKHIPRTQNLNGIFINLSVLDIQYIQLLYNYVKHYNYNNNLNQNLLIENQFNQYKTILSDINNKQIKFDFKFNDIKDELKYYGINTSKKKKSYIF